MLSVLMILNGFAPTNNCSAIPNTKLVKYLARKDLEITLLTDEITPDMDLDQELIPMEVNCIDTFYIGNSKLYKATFGKTRTKITNNGIKLKMKSETKPIRAYIVSIIKNTFFWIRREDWMICARYNVRKVLKNKHFDIIYSTYPATQAHLLAKVLMKKGIADRWIADFRDPMCYMEYDRFRYKRSMRLQHRIERAADFITVVSKGAKEKFLPENQEKKKIAYIPNGYDPDDYSTVLSRVSATKDMFRLFYAGSLYAGRRDLTVIFRAMSELAAENKIDLDRVTVEYAGNEWKTLISYAEKYNLERICKNYGYISRHHVMEIMGEVDCTIVCSHNTAVDQGVVTGKLFELLLVEKPIITVITGSLPGSELGEIVRECSAGVVYEEPNADRDYPSLKAWLMEQYQEKMLHGSVKSILADEAREFYSYQHIASMLCGIFHEVSNNS